MEQKLFESCFNQKMNTFISQHSKNQIEEKFLRLTINNNFVKIFSDENTKGNLLSLQVTICFM